MKTKVNTDLCIGCGACAAIVPDVFEIGEDGLAEVINEKQIPEELIDEVKDASEGCPTNAITVEGEK